MRNSATMGSIWYPVPRDLRHSGPDRPLFLLQAALYNEEMEAIRAVSNENEKQRRLLNESRVHNQFRWFQDALHYKPPTYYSELAEIGLYILENGRPAQTSRKPSEADFLVMDCDRWQEWLQKGTGEKIIVLRDRRWFQTRPEVFGSTLLQTYKQRHPQSLKIDVQDYDRLHEGPGTTFVVSQDIEEAISRFKADRPRKCPVNLLNMSSKEDGLVPWPLAKHCTMLNDAAAVAVNVAQTTYKGVAGPGKEYSETMTKAIDLQSCMR